MTAQHKRDMQGNRTASQALLTRHDPNRSARPETIRQATIDAEQGRLARMDSQWTPVERLISLKGPHWILPDLHGEHELLLRALDRIGDDPLIQLGDLIDRGPDSAAVCDTLLGRRLRVPTTLIRGNHEDMMLRELSGQRWNWLRENEVTIQSIGKAGLHSLAQALSASQHIGALIETSGPHGEAASVMVTHALRPGGSRPARLSSMGQLPLELFGRVGLHPQKAYAAALREWPAGSVGAHGQAHMKLSVHGHTVHDHPRLLKESDTSRSLFLDLGSGKDPQEKKLALLDLSRWDIHELRLRGKRAHWTVRSFGEWWS